MPTSFSVCRAGPQGGEWVDWEHATPDCHCLKERPFQEKFRSEEDFGSQDGRHSEENLRKREVRIEEKDSGTQRGASVSGDEGGGVCGKTGAGHLESQGGSRA